MIKYLLKLRRCIQTHTPMIILCLLLFSTLPSVGSVSLFPPGQETSDDDQVTICVVAEQSQEPLTGAVVRCEGVNPAITDTDGRCVFNLKHGANNVKVFYPI